MGNLFSVFLGNYFSVRTAGDAAASACARGGSAVHQRHRGTQSDAQRGVNGGVVRTRVEIRVSVDVGGHFKTRHRWALFEAQNPPFS